MVAVFWHKKRPAGAWRAAKYRDDVGPPGKPLRPLYNAEIHYSGQPIALVVAESFEIARHAAALVRVTYRAEAHDTDFTAARGRAAVPSRKRNGIPGPAGPEGDAEKAQRAAPFKIAGEYRIATEHHNPMEPHATTVVYDGGKLTIHDKIQGVTNSHGYVTRVFGLKEDDVRVISPYVGGGFGSGLRPHHQLFLAVMASLGSSGPCGWN